MIDELGVGEAEADVQARQHVVVIGAALLGKRATVHERDDCIAEAAGLRRVQPGIGDQFLLPAFAATFLGATTITPGRFNVWGTVIAVYLLGAGLAGLQQSGAPFYVEPIFNGVALLLAIGLSIVLRRSRTS